MSRTGACFTFLLLLGAIYGLLTPIILSRRLGDSRDLVFFCPFLFGSNSSSNSNSSSSSSNSNINNGFSIDGDVPAKLDSTEMEDDSVSGVLPNAPVDFLTTRENTTCLGPARPWELLVANKNWQVLKTKVETLYLYSAVYDDTKIGVDLGGKNGSAIHTSAVIRILALVICIGVVACRRTKSSARSQARSQA